MIVLIETPWRSADYATRPRTAPPSLIVGHWTAGTGGKVFSDDLDTVWRRMRARKGKDGNPMRVSVHYCIGRDGRIGEYADPETVTCFGVGHSAINARGIHVEVVNPGIGKPSERYPSKHVRHAIGTHNVQQLAFLPAQLAAWAWLADHLCTRFKIPKQTITPFDRSLTNAEARGFRGIIEHLNVPGTTKIDAGTQLVRGVK